MAKKTKKVTKKPKKKVTKKPKKQVKKKKVKKKHVKRGTKKVKSPSVELYFEKEVKDVEKKWSHKPIVAAILNFFAWGVGFMYIGRMIYGLLWLFSGVLVILPVIRMQRFLPVEMMAYLTIGYWTISILLALDAYFQAKEILHWHD